MYVFIHAYRWISLLIANKIQGHREAGAYPSWHNVKGGVHPAQVTSVSQANRERETTVHTHIHTYPHINQTWRSLDCERKSVHLERTQACPGKNTISKQKGPIQPGWNQNSFTLFLLHSIKHGWRLYRHLKHPLKLPQRICDMCHRHH